MSQVKNINGQINVGSVSQTTGDGTLNAQGLFKNGVEVTPEKLNSFININNSIGARVKLTTTAVTNIYQYVGTGRALLTGLTVANINGATESEISLFIRDNSLGVDFSITNRIPVPAKTSLELLRKPKVLEPNDIIRAQALAANHFDIIATIVEFDDLSLFNAFYNTIAAAVISPVSVYTETNPNGSVIESILINSTEIFANQSNNEQGTLVSVSLFNGSQDSFLCYDLVVPEKCTIELCENPKFLANGHSVRIKVSEADKVKISAHGRKII